MSAVVPSCGRRLFPPAYFPQVPVADVQQELRAAFGAWGLPQTIRVDNGSPWGSWNDFPPALALWLLGLGIAMHWNDPGRPQQNGVVERSQGTGQRWAEPQTCRTLAELQQRLDADDRRQREEYPYLGTRSRRDVYPGLRHSGRAYVARQEARRWQWRQALEHLAQYTVGRRVDGSGTISVYNRTLYVGPRYAGQVVWVRLDPQEVEWVVAAESGTQIRTKPAKELTAAAIRGLRVAGAK